MSSFGFPATSAISAAASASPSANPISIGSGLASSVRGESTDSSEPATTTPGTPPADPTTTATTATATATTVTPPARTTATTATTATGALPDVGLPGVNVPSCRSAKRPVVLLHGSFSTTASNFSALSRALRTSGRCVYALDYGNGGVLSIRSSADQFTAFVATVRTLSGSTEVDVIGYSQGGLVLRTALHFNGLVGQVNTAVLLAPSWHGTTARLAGSIPAALCPACADQAAGSPLLRALDAGGELAAGVHYAEISTRADVVVTPINSQIPIGPASRVRSAVVEDLCPGLVTDHIQLPATRAAISWTISALDTNGRPASNGLTC